MKIYFVTGNKGKQATAQSVFEGTDIEIECYDYDFIEPDVNDLDFIASEKVKQAYSIINAPCISQDSGFYVPAYPLEENWPGAFVHRKLIDGIGIEKFLEIMKDIPNRECCFKQSLAYYDGKEVKLFHSVSNGKLTYESTGKSKKQQWSSLWSIFIPEGYSVTLSELTDEDLKARELRSVSAFEKFRSWILKDK